MLYLAIQATHRRFIFEIWDHANCHFPHFPFCCCIEYVLSDTFPGPRTRTRFRPPPPPIYSVIVAPTNCDEPILDEIFPSEVSAINSWTTRVSSKPRTHPFHARAFSHIGHSYEITSQIKCAE